MKKIIIAIFIATSLISAEKSDEITKLSTGLKSLLSAEMIEVEKGMKNILTYIISGDYESLTEEARSIKNSFILKKELTKVQTHELHTKVSSDFLVFDKSFHEIAGKLANAAEFEDKKQINMYYGEMLNSCVTCHSKFATHRFSNFE